MNRAQTATIDRLALDYGRVAVRDGFADGSVHATVPGGACWVIDTNGTAASTHPNHSIDWSY